MEDTAPRHRRNALSMLAMLVALISVVLNLVVLGYARREARRARADRGVVHEPAGPVPILQHLRTTTLGGQVVKLVDHPLRIDAKLDIAARAVPRGVATDPFLLEPERFVEFHPFQWAGHLLALSDRLRRGEKLTALQPAIDAELARGAQYEVQRDGALYCRYPFAFDVGPNCHLEPGWVSGFAQGMILAAYVDLAETSHDDRFLERARMVFRSFLLPRDHQGQSEPWVSVVDESQYLWFEEYPLPHDPQPRVLNGHIYALMGIYAYHRREPTPESEALLRAGTTTIQRYGMQYRRPGQVNRYGLGLADLPDYGPKRSVDQQQWLFDLTSEPAFANTRDAFLTDMSYR